MPRVPEVIKNLIIINILFFLATMSFETFMVKNFALFYFDSVFFKPHQFITHIFMHGGFSHIFFNMLMLWMFGAPIENLWGSKKFLIYYVLTGFGAAALHLLIFSLELNMYEGTDMYYRMLNTPMLGASGAVFGILLAFGMTFPNQQIFLIFPPIPIKAKYMVIFMAVIELYVGFTVSDNVAHFAHLGGMLFGYILIKYWKQKPYV